MKSLLIRVLASLLLVATARAQISFVGGVYSQNFDALPGATNNVSNTTWTDNSTLPGWYANKTTFSVTDGTIGGTAATFDSSSSTANNVGLFSFGTAGSVERALGSRATSNFAGNDPVLYGVRLVNGTGQTLTKFTVTYTGEQWFKSSAATAHTVLVDYQFGAASIATGTWTAVSAATFTAPIATGTTATALNGNTAANRSVKVAVVTGVSWVPGQELWVRFRDANESGNEQGLAVDDFNFLADDESGLFFNGSTSYVTMGFGAASATAFGASDFTVECRFLRTGTGVTASTGNQGVVAVPLIAKGVGEADASNKDANYFLGIDANGRLTADFEQLNATNNGTAYAAGQNFPITGSTILQNGVWYHVAATYNTVTATWKLYVNGVEESTSVPGTSPATFVGVVPRSDSIQGLGLGTTINSTGAVSGFFHGIIDEARIWNIARTPAQILAGKDLKIVSGETGMIARFGLDEAAGTSVAGTTAAGAATPAGTLSGTTLPAWVNAMSFGPNVSPTVALTAPADGSSVVFPGVINFAATASDGDGTIAKVEFFDGAVKVGEDLTFPYTFAWPGAPVGTHSLTAVATDNRGATTASAAVAVTVLPNPNQPPVVTATAPVDEATGIGSATTVSVSIADPENAATTVTFYGRKTTPIAAGAEFSVIAIPDTQFYSENTGRNPSAGGTGAIAAIFNAQTQWIVDNRTSRNIAFVSHMGDIVQNGDFSGNPSEWLRADFAMKTIESPLATLRAYGLPWGGAPGNHDYGTGGGSGSTTFYNQYFGTSRFAGRNYFGGHYGIDNNNNYELFSASGLDFIVIHLEYNAGALSSYQAVLDWADALLKAYPDRRAIVTSHYVIGAGNPAAFSTQGQNIYNALKDNPNLFLMLCGHITGEGRRSDMFAGKTVYSVLQDYQDIKNGGDGFLRIFTFKPAGSVANPSGEIVVESYSPTLGRAVTAADAVTGWTPNYALPYNMQSAVTDWIPLGTVNVAAAGTSAALNWTGLEAGGRYEWYAAVTDGINVVSSAARHFSTTNPISPTVTLTSPTDGASYAPPGTISLTATANDPDGSVARVDFFAGDTKLGEDASAPYQFTWSGATSGTYSLTAVAVDNSGRATLSGIANITVTGSAPTLTLTSPTNGATLNAPGTINFAATAGDSDGTVAKVEFYQGSFKVGEAATPPFTFAWNNVAPGNYLLYAVATDNAGNRTASVAASNVVSAVASSGTLTRGPYVQKAAPTQMTIRWRSSVSTVGRVRYGSSVMNLSQFVDEAAAPPSPFDHTVTLTGLTANTTYYYSVGSASDTLASGPDYTFTTPPATGTPVSARVWVMGDAGTSGNSASPTAAQTAVRDAFYSWTGTRTPNLVLQLGDNAYNSGTDGEFQKGMFDIYPAMLRKTPFWSCLGNHETAQATAFVDTYPYFDIYTLPTAGESGGVASGTEHYYSFDYGNIHFISLDSMTANRSPAGAMAVWLQSDLASTTATWIICFFHHPPYTKGSHNSDTETELIEMRANILPILEAGGVDLVLTGHSHCYERSYLLDGHYDVSGTLTPAMKKNAGDGRPLGNGAYIKPLTGPRDHFGAVYAVAGCAGQATGGSLNHPAHYISLNNLGSLVLDVNGTRLDATFLRENSSTPDTFTIIKQGAADSDGDGIPDDYEIAHGLDRHNAADAALDSDGDGVSNLREFVFATASNVSDRYAFFTTYDSLSGAASVTFPTSTGRTYRVFFSGDLLSWQPASAVVAGTGATMVWTDDGTATGSLPAASGKRFYRILVTVVP